LPTIFRFEDCRTRLEFILACPKEESNNATACKFGEEKSGWAIYTKNQCGPVHQGNGRVLKVLFHH